uniref:Uncharacterized protein n=1 Tax=Globodera rostochiensis TaxID=31243 RepID=A0A914HUB4_GLORO
MRTNRNSECIEWGRPIGNGKNGQSSLIALKLRIPESICAGPINLNFKRKRGLASDGTETTTGGPLPALDLAGTACMGWSLMEWPRSARAWSLFHDPKNLRMRGKGACIGHMGYDKSTCCSANFELQCCVDISTTTVAAPVIVQVSKACDKKKEACVCGWGNCIQKDGMAASNCCSDDYAFTCCCTTAPTTETTTTLLPEQKLEKACNDAATLYQCGWARCIETDGIRPNSSWNFAQKTNAKPQTSSASAT